jgi:hypothetical protein
VTADPVIVDDDLAIFVLGRPYISVEIRARSLLQAEVLKLTGHILGQAAQDFQQVSGLLDRKFLAHRYPGAGFVNAESWNLCDGLFVAAPGFKVRVEIVRPLPTGTGGER